MAPRFPIASERLLALAGLALAVATFSPAAAHADDKATAQVLFDAGRKLMDEGNYAAACPKLAESQRLDPGGGTLLNLALCHEKEGKTATAWGEFTEALGVARAAGRQDRIDLATEHIQALKPTLSRLTVTVSPDAKVEGLVITVDDTALGEPVWGMATPVDPGEHVVAARAPGHQPWETTVTLGAEADQQAVMVPPLQPSPTPPAAPPPPTAPPTSPSTSPPQPGPDTTKASDGSTQRLVGFIVGGVGMAGAVVGAVFGGLAIAKEGEAEDNGCNDEICTTDKGMEASDAAQTNATLSNVFIGAGAGLAVAGLILVLTAPDGPDQEAPTGTAVAPWLGPGEAGLVARFAF